MSEEIWPVPVEKIEKALRDWQTAEPDDDTTDADALVECLLDQGLQILPIVEDDTPYVVEVDGEPVSRPYLPSPHTPGDAVGLWIAALAEQDSPVVLRPATDDEIAESDTSGREILRRDLNR